MAPYSLFDAIQDSRSPEKSTQIVLKRHYSVLCLFRHYCVREAHGDVSAFIRCCFNKVTWLHWSNILSPCCLLYLTLQQLKAVRLTGQHWNPGLHTWTTVLCHLLYLQVPCATQSSKWQTTHEWLRDIITSCCFKWLLRELDLIFPFSTEDRCWHWSPPPLACCAQWLVPSSLLPYSSTTLGWSFFWGSCRGCCQQYAVLSWTFLYPWIGHCDRI